MVVTIASLLWCFAVAFIATAFVDHFCLSFARSFVRSFGRTYSFIANIPVCLSPCFASSSLSLFDAFLRERKEPNFIASAQWQRAHQQTNHFSFIVRRLACETFIQRMNRNSQPTNGWTFRNTKQEWYSDAVGDGIKKTEHKDHRHVSWLAGWNHVVQWTIVLKFTTR